MNKIAIIGAGAAGMTAAIAAARTAEEKRIHVRSSCWNTTTCRAGRSSLPEMADVILPMKRWVSLIFTARSSRRPPSY